MELDSLLQMTVERDATDLHLTINSPPVIRINGELEPVDLPVLTAAETRELAFGILTDKQKAVLEKDQSLDLAYTINVNGSVVRFRVNLFFQRGAVAGAFRKLAQDIPSLEELHFPDALYKLCEMQDGLILVTGPTGSGKSTTLASLIDRINETKPCHIIAIEDPVEYIHFHKKALVNQREVHTDVISFSDGLRAALREDPDVILVGEMRDLETIRTAIMAAETGHLVLSTLHTRDATSTISRIVGVFPTDEQEQTAHQLSLTLKAVVSQRLLKCKDGSGRVPAAEIMLSTPGIANMIRMHKMEQIRSVIETSAGMGMQSMEHSLVRLFKENKIDKETVLKNARDIKYIERLIK